MKEALDMQPTVGMRSNVVSNLLDSLKRPLRGLFARSGSKGTKARALLRVIYNRGWSLEMVL